MTSHDIDAILAPRHILDEVRLRLRLLLRVCFCLQRGLGLHHGIPRRLHGLVRRRNHNRSRSLSHVR